MAITALSACGGGDGNGGGGSSGGGDEGSSVSPADYTGEHTQAPESLTVRIDADWDHFDIQSYADRGSMGLVLPAYDRLVARDKKLEIVPYLAESWEVTPTSVKFQLPPEPKAKCADGTPVTADVVLKSFRRLLTVEKESNFLPNQFGPGPYKVSADDAANTFTFETETPFRGLLAGFANGISSIVCPEGLKNTGKMKTQMFGSGPYELVSARRGAQIEWKLKEDYDWGPDGTSIDTMPRRLVYRVVTNATTAANLLTTKDLDIAQVTGPDLNRLVSDRSLLHVKAQNYHSYPLNFNQNPGHLTTDESLRRALMHAVDPEQFNEAAFGGFGVVSPSLNAPGSQCYDESLADSVPTPSIDEGRKVLEEAGYTYEGDSVRTPDGKPVKLRLLTSTLFGSAGEYLSTQYGKLGIDVELANLDQAQYSVDVLEADFDVTVSSFAVNTPDPGQDLFFYTGKTPKEGGVNFSNAGNGDEEMNRLASEAAATLGEEACPLFQELNRLLIEKAYIYPLAAPTVDQFSHNWDFTPISNWWEPFHYAQRAES